MLLLASLLVTLLTAQVEYRAASTRATVFAPASLHHCLLEASLSADMRLPIAAEPNPDGNFELTNLEPDHRYFLRLTCDGTLADAALLFTEPDSPKPAPAPEPTCLVPAREVTAPDAGGILQLALSPDCGQFLSKEVSWLRFQPHSSDALIHVDANPGAARQTAVHLGSEEVVIRQAAATNCSFNLGSSWYPGSAGSYSLTIPAPPGCSWSVISSPNWVILSSATTGTGPGQVSYSLNANGNSLRSGVLTLSTGQSFILNQLPGSCTGSGDNTSWFPFAGGTYTFDLTAPSGCSWMLTSTVNWIRINSALSGSGAASVTYTIDPNTGPSRSGTLAAIFSGGTVTRTIQQPAYIFSGTCTYSLTVPTSNLNATAQTLNIGIVTANGCPWSVLSGATWAVPQTTSGSGPASIMVQVAANGTTSARTVTLGIAGQTVSLTQAGAACNPTFASSGSFFPKTAGTYSVPVIAPEGCPWNAVALAGLVSTFPVYFAKIEAGPMSGTGILTFSLTENNEFPRVTRLLVGSSSWYSITQMGDPCFVAFSPISTWVPYWPTTVTISVITGAGCPWTVTSDVPWVQFSNSSGTGPGQISSTTLFNTTPDVRSGNLSIRGARFPISQVGWK